MPEDGRPAEPSRGLVDLALGLLGAAAPPAADHTGPEPAFLAQHAARLGPAAGAGDRVAARLVSPGSGDAALSRAARALDLGPAEVLAVALALAVEMDALAGRAVAWLQVPVAAARPTLGLLASVLAPVDPRPGLVTRLASGQAVRAGLCRLEGGGPMPERSLRLPDGLIAALTGAEPSWPGLTLPDPGDAPPWPGSVAAALAPISKALAGDTTLLPVVRAASTGDRLAVLSRIAAETGRRPALVELEAAEIAGLGPLCAAARLLPGIVVNPGAGEYLALPDLPGHDGPVVAFIGPEGTTGRPGLRQIDWAVPVPSPAERARLWRGIVGDTALAERLGAEHLQSAGRIAEIAGAAQAAASVAGKASPDATALRAALWTCEGEGLGALAHPVHDDIPDDALVAAPALMRELQTLLARCRRRERLTLGLGPAITARYKLGVKALFTGPSGTGKTLGAAWLAGRLTLPLYRVDLASVVSKYIGETEKNLAQLLARAEEQEVVLLFDEADSLFGKRTEVSDANDRFANAQTNYLLQRIETYTGIVLLTSNARSRFDEAFTRRIDMIVEFLMPQPVERLALWQAHLGDRHRVCGGDLNRLAAMAELAGGHIRNVVLMAAVQAAEDGGDIAYAHLLSGLRSEYRKLGWTVPAELLSTGG